MKLSYQALSAPIKERMEAVKPAKLSRHEQIKRNKAISKKLRLVFDVTTDDGKKLLAKQTAGIEKHRKMLADKNVKSAV
jgi:uncharacterized protein YehS (DUF1456 family)